MLLYVSDRCFGHVEDILTAYQRKKEPAALNQQAGSAVVYRVHQNEILPPSCQNLGSCDNVAWPKFPSGKFTSIPPAPFHA